MKLTANQREVLWIASFYEADQWCRPMDLGGRDSSHHSATAAALAKRGLLERRDRGSLAKCRAVWLYRITDAGREALQAEERGPTGPQPSPGKPSNRVPHDPR